MRRIHCPTSTGLVETNHVHDSLLHTASSLQSKSTGVLETVASSGRTGHAVRTVPWQVIQQLKLLSPLYLTENPWGLPVPINPVCILIQQRQVTRETAACSLCKYLKPRLRGLGHPNLPISWPWHGLTIYSHHFWILTVYSLTLQTTDGDDQPETWMVKNT